MTDWSIVVWVLAALLVVGALVWFGRSRSRAGGQDVRRSALGSDLPVSPLPRDYSPKNVGNDASARPWEQSVSTFGPDALPVSTASTVAGQPAPEDFDVGGFLLASKDNFVKLQDAWDRADVPALRAMMTDEMIAQIQAQLAEREKHTGRAANKTDVVMLEAQLLSIEELPGEYMASVEFSGLIREEPSAGPNPFREVWSITRPKTGQGGWLVAGVQALG